MRGKQIVRSATKTVRKISRYRSVRIVVGLVIVVAVFEAGINVGNGRLSLHSHAVSGNLPSSLDYSSVNQVYQSLKANYNGKLTESQLLDGLKHGLATATNDPYTEYFTAAEANSFSSQLNGNISGIGAELGKDDQGNIQVIAPVAGTPAEQAGLKPKDLIIGVDGKSTAGFSVDQAVSVIRGQAGTKVTLQLVRGNGNPFEVTITRQAIHVPSVTTKTLDNNIGYIQISTFGDDTGDLVTKAANNFKQAGVKGIVLDLRNNPGGEVNAAVTAVSQWLPSGDDVMDEKRGNTVIQSYQSTGPAELQGIPTVVLVNAGSASASEITAAALHDNHAAYIMGEKSYGKGVVQQLINFGDGSELKVTIASWYRPNGQNINHKGITPDQIVTLNDQDATAGNDTQLTAAEAYLNK